MRRASAWIALVTIALAPAVVVPGRATAGAATDAVRPAVEGVLQILQDPALKGAAKTPQRRAALRAVMEGVIDFPDAARRALGIHWQGRTEAERDEFVGLFKDLVTSSYIVTMEGYAGQTVLFTGESRDEDVTVVLTKIQGRQGPLVPVEYRTHQRGDRWLVYDVVVEGVSLVANYRAQFNTVIRTSSYAELIRRIRTKVGELTAPTVAARRWPEPG